MEGEFIAEIYNKVYIVIVMIMTLLVLKSYWITSDGRCRTEPSGFNSRLIWLVIFMVLFIGFRPISAVFMDMLDYSTSMTDHRYENVDYTYNYVFTPMMALMSSNGAPQRLPILVLAAINFIVTYFAIRKLFPQNQLLAYLVFLGCFMTFGCATNGLKSGCAAAWLLLSVAYRDNLKYSLFFLFMALGFHHSMMMMVAAFGVSFFYRNTKPYMIVWVVCLVLAFMHIKYFQLLFAGYTDEHGAEYLTIDEDNDYFSGSGFRYDFVLYSSLPVILGYYYLFRRNMEDKYYQFMLNTYLVGNSVYFLCMFANYSYRIAFLSWGLYPALILYPFLKLENEFTPYKMRLFKRMLILCITFTLVIFFVKY